MGWLEHLPWDVAQTSVWWWAGVGWVIRLFPGQHAVSCSSILSHMVILLSVYVAFVCVFAGDALSGSCTGKCVDFI